MGTFANLADIKAIENEQPWEQRDVARSMYEFLTRARDAHGARPAISYQIFSGPQDKSKTLTWNDLHRQVTQAANLFRSLKIAESDVVALILPNTLETAVATIGGFMFGYDSGVINGTQDGLEAASDKASFFEQCDVLCLHLRLADSTTGCVTLEDLARMKPTAVLVNTSRAELIEPDALLGALNRGRPGMAAVDVFESEPILQGHALLRLENCICTPHIGYVEQDSYEAYFASAFDNVVNYIKGTPTNIVNPGALQVRR